MTDKTILDKILNWKRQEVAQNKKAKPVEVMRAEVMLASPPRDFAAALAAPGVALIAEVKRASPSKGLLRHKLDAAALAQVYEANGAAAVSVLTDQRFFQGNLMDLQAVKRRIGLPALRKDFIIDAYQIYQARSVGADAILLIVAALSDKKLHEFYRLAGKLGMVALVEVHNEAELERALAIQPQIIGVNNRDLSTFKVDLEVTARLRSMIPIDVLMVSESGIHSATDVKDLAAMGADAILVGESLVRAKDVAARVRELTGETL